MSDVTFVSPESGRTANQVERGSARAVNWIVLASLPLAFVLRLKTALGTFLNPDEALHYVLINQNTLAEAYRASLTNAHPPLYFVFLYYWRFVGNSELMLRLPSVVASTLLAWVAFRWISLALNKTAGLIMFLLLAFSPMLIGLGAEVRDYSLLLLWMTGALYFLERAFRDHAVLSIAWSSLFLYLAILTHYSALWFVIAAGIYTLLRISSLRGSSLIAWFLFQCGGVGIYLWLYLVHISKMRGSPMEAEAMTGWLRALYFRAGESRAAFLHRRTVDVFQFLFSNRTGGNIALILFAAGILWLAASGLWLKKASLAAFGVLLVLPFALGMAASLMDVYPYGGTRHCSYLLPFAAAGVAALIATLVRQRIVPVLVLAVLVLPYGYLHRLKDPQQMDRAAQAKQWMDGALADLRSSVPPGDPLFSDYQTSIELEYYLGRERPPAPARECGGVREVQYGPYRVVDIGGWSATAAQLTAGIEGWRAACHPAPRDAVWVFDAGWGLNLLDDMSQSAAGSVSEGRHFGETISLFKLHISNQ